MAKPPVVLMVAPLPPGNVVGGIATGVRMLLESRVAAETSMRLFNTYRSRDASRTTFQRVTYQALAAVRFVWTVLTTRPKIVHVKAASYINFYQSALYVALARVLGRKVILQLHAGDFPQFYGHASAWKRAVIRTALRAPNRLMALSESWARYFRALAGVESIAVVPNALDTAAYAVEPNRETFGIPSDRVAVLFVGTYNRAADEAKGLPELVAAFARARKSTPELLLVVAGVAAEDEVIGPTLGPAGSSWLGVGVVSTDRKPVLYRSVDIFALPTHFENMPNTLIEAMAAGLPAIATRVGAIPEMIQDGESGVLVDVKDVTALSAQLDRLAADRSLREHIGRRAAETAVERFDFSILESRMLAEYDRIVTASRGSQPEGEPVGLVVRHPELAPQRPQNRAEGHVVRDEVVR